MTSAVQAAIETPMESELGAFLGEGETFRRLDTHVRAWFPREACALVFRSSDGLELELVDNLADDFHAADPEAFPRSATTAFILDARAIARAERAGRRLVAIVHSHPDGTVAFSAEDRRLALTPDGQFPLYPEVFHVVLAAPHGHVRAQAAYVWCANAADFVPIDAGPDRWRREIV
jgi:proteasome lid subunit RPN8/RPN11